MAAAVVAVILTMLDLRFGPRVLSVFFSDVLHFPCDTVNPNCDNMSTFLPSFAVIFLELGLITGALFVVVIGIAPRQDRASLSRDLRLASAIFMTLCALPVAAYSFFSLGSLVGVVGVFALGLWVASIAALFASLGGRSKGFSIAATGGAVVAILLCVATRNAIFVVAGILVAYPLAALLALALPARRGAPAETAETAETDEASTPATPAP